MAKIASQSMTIGKSDSPDVVGYRVRVVGANVPVSYDTAYHETQSEVVDISTIPALKDADGTFDFYVSAFDEVGNESDFVSASGVVVDFHAPLPPSGISFSTS